MYPNRFALALAMAGLAAVLLPSSLPAQITFQRTYGGTGEDYGYSVQQTVDSGYIIAGQTGYLDMSNVYLVRTDPRGDTLWTRTFGGAAVDIGYSVQQTTDGGFVVAGVTSSFGAGNEDIYLIKTDANGDTMWIGTNGGTDYDWGSSVRQTIDGGYIITGNTVSFGAGGNDVYLIKTNTNGETLWTRTYGGTDVDMGHSVQQTVDGGYIVAGYTAPSGEPDDVYLVKTDGNGDTMWTGTYGGTDLDVAYSVQQTTDSGYIIAGTTGSFGAGRLDVYLIKSDAEGNVLWTRTFGGTDCDEGYSVQPTTDGGYIVAGYTRPFGEPDYDVYLVKTDADGDTLWTRILGGQYFDFGRSVRQTRDGGYVIAGYTWSSGTGSTDAYLIKTDSLGHVAVAEPKTSPTRAPAPSLSCEPNPFRTRTAISLQLTPDSPAEVAIFDAGGRRVRTLAVNREPYTVWDGEDDFGQPLPSGTYFAVLAAGGHYATARLVLQR